MSLKDFQIIVSLGEGAYSSVYKVKRLKDNKQYALKKVKINTLSEKQKQNALNEVRILASINHSNIIAYKQAFLDELSNSLCIVMQYADDGDLYQKITEHQKKQTYFKQAQIWNIIVQVVKGLKALHKAKILHRDLKSANVFLCKNGDAKLGDMNVSKISEKGLCQTQTGTPYYASPQVWKDLPYDNKSDIWSLGCVLYEMTTLKPPFRAEDMEGLYKKVVRGLYPRIPIEFSTDLSNVIRSMLQVAPQWRPTAEKILSMTCVIKRTGDLIRQSAEQQQQIILLNTIKIPRNMTFLGKELPKPNYAQQQRLQKKKQHKTLSSIEPQNQTTIFPSSQSIQKIRSPRSKPKEIRIQIRPREKSVGLLPILNKLPPIKK